MKRFINLFPIIVALIFASCGSDQSVINESSEVSNETEKMVVTQAQFELSNMIIGSFSNESFKKVIKTNGSLAVPPENKATISAYFGGYVKDISLLQGQQIKKGQTLFTLENPEYIQVQQDFLESKSQLAYLKSDYERQKELSADNVSSKKVFLKAESDYKVTQARYESLKKKLQLMNIDPSAITASNLRTTISVKAPISGYVTSVLATKGLYLNPSDIALTIMNTEHLHIELNIFEQDLSTIKIGQEVSFKMMNNPTQYNAKVYLINKAIDPEKRTIKVHCHLIDEKESERFTPGMYVEAEIFTSIASTAALPVDAVVSVEDKTYLLELVEKSDTQYSFIRKEVEIGQSNEQFVEILNAGTFNPETKILTKGAFNLIQE
jgi:membrane fusion protein, heavy metal efflux system